MKSSPSGPSRVQRTVVAFGVAIPFLGCVAAIVLMWCLGWMGWLYLALLVGGWLITGLGVTVGFHRLLSHRSFKTHSSVRAFWAALGAFAVEGPPLTWCATHRKHHELSDQPGDPHSPHCYGEGGWNVVRGLFYSHLGWMFINDMNDSMLKRYVPDLQKDWILVGIERYYAFWVMIGLAAPALIGLLVTFSWKGALLGFLWGGLVRVFFVHHVTWSINSICHTFGHRDYDVADLSRNNFICALLGHGEGWHNNHHAFPSSARHGLRWWQFDLSWLVIRAMQAVGIVWHVRTPEPQDFQTTRFVEP